MKDSKGHGSDPKGAASSGVQQVGQPKTYTWTKMPHGMGHVLANNGNYADQLGSVHPVQDSVGHRMYRGSYNYSDSAGGNQPSNSSFHGSVQGAKKFVESNLSKFWNPPKVGK